MTSRSAAIPVAVHDQAMRHLIRADRQEDVCFALWNPSNGRTRTTALLVELILPDSGDRVVHGNVEFTSQYFERSLGRALESSQGLALLHSHPGPGWQDMSEDDLHAERIHAKAVNAATGLPLVGLTLGTDGSWSARFWEARVGVVKQAWCASTRVVGEFMDVTYHDGLLPPPRFRNVLRRTVSAWGPHVQATLSRLTIGLVGAGSVGSIVAEALARMGIRHLKLIDFDSVESVNLDRLLHAYPEDALGISAKVQVLARALRRSATAESFVVEPLEMSVVEEDGFRTALDCDVLFSCVDRPWARSALNLIAYAHLIPVVDGGVLAEALPGEVGLRRADIRAHIAGPGRRCLECLGQFDPGLVAVERDGLLENPTYIAGLPANHPLRRNENVFGFAAMCASLEIMQFLHMVLRPLDLNALPPSLYHFVFNELDVDKPVCNNGCPYAALSGLGDRSPVSLVGHHVKASLARGERASASRGVKGMWRRILGFIHRSRRVFS